MTVYRIVWILPSGEERPDTEVYPSQSEALMMAFRMMAWTGIAVDYEIGATRLN